MLKKLFPYPKKKIQHGSMEKPAAYQNGTHIKNLRTKPDAKTF